MAQAQRLQELKDQQTRWMRERQAEMDRHRVMAEMQSASSGSFQSGVSGSGRTASYSSPSPAEGTLPQQQTRTRGSGLMGNSEDMGPMRTRSDTHARQSGGPGPPPQQQQGVGYATAGGIRPEQVIDKLTERITDRLRSELKVELQRETQDLAAQATAHAMVQEGFLAKELETQNTCPICYELMVPPDRAPHILFPCGHTFCHSCARTHMEQHHRNHCPVCRKTIESRALNYPLQQLIMNWVARRDSGRGPGLGSTGVQGSDGEGAGREDVHGQGGADEIRRRCERVELRLRVLKNELLDVMAEEESLSTRQAAVAAVAAHLSDAEQDALAQVAAAQAQLNLVRQQQEAQSSKAAELDELAARLHASRTMLVDTISPLEEDHGKLTLLVAGIREAQQHH